MADYSAMNRINYRRGLFDCPASQIG